MTVCQFSIVIENIHCGVLVFEEMSADLFNFLELNGSVILDINVRIVFLRACVMRKYSLRCYFV